MKVKARMKVNDVIDGNGIANASNNFLFTEYQSKLIPKKHMKCIYFAMVAPISFH